MMVHGLLAVALIGAMTPSGDVGAGAGPAAASGGFVTRFRAVQGAGYATAIVCWIVTFIFGAVDLHEIPDVCPHPDIQAQLWKTLGVFDLKEHVAVLGLFLLPIYWYLWKNARTKRQPAALADRPDGCDGLVLFWLATSSTT